MSLNDRQRNRRDELARRRWQNIQSRRAERDRSMNPEPPTPLTDDSDDGLIQEVEPAEATVQPTPPATVTVDFESVEVRTITGRFRPAGNGEEFIGTNLERTRAYTHSRPVGWWQMRDQRWIRIIDMEDSHLLNCIRMVERLPRGRLSEILAELVAEYERRRSTHERIDLERFRPWGPGGPRVWREGQITWGPVPGAVVPPDPEPDPVPLNPQRRIKK